MQPAKPKLLVRKPSCRGLSLIEVTIALGIFAFSIVAILGLLTTTLHSDQGAANDTTLAMITETTMTQLRGQGIAELRIAYTANQPRTNFFYDSAGMLQTQLSADSRYSCAVTRTPTTSPNLDYLKLEFRWPASAPATRQESRIVNASFANEY